MLGIIGKSPLFEQGSPLYTMHVYHNNHSYLISIKCIKDPIFVFNKINVLKLVI